MFTTVTGEALKDRITTAKTRVVFVAPGVTEDVSKALVEAHHRSVFVTVILDLDQDACRIGFGDPEGLAYLREHGSTVHLYQQAGMRIGLLLADEVLTIWSPTPRSVENDRREGQPNAIVLDGRIVGDSLGNDVIESLKNEKIGGTPIRPDELQTVVAKLERDPPTPFDLARKGESVFYEIPICGGYPSGGRIHSEKDQDFQPITECRPTQEPARRA